MILGDPASDAASSSGAVPLNAPFNGFDLGRMALQATEDIEINDDVFITTPAWGLPPRPDAI